MDSEDQKRQSLSERIRKAGQKPAGDVVSDGAAGAGRIGFDFVGSIAVCGIVGELADRAFKTSPWCLLTMIVAGFVIGIFGAWQTMKKSETKE